MKKRCAFLLLLLILPLIAANTVEETTPYVQTGVSLLKITLAILVLGTFVVILFKKNIVDHHKKIAFLVIVIPVVISSLYFAGAIVHENMVSITGGPIHWHADYQIWVCGERLDLIDPRFPSNKIGTPLYHEHNDDRLHVEGTVMNWDSVNLDRYFQIIGGSISDNHFAFRTNTEVIDVKNGDSCPDGSIGELKVYVNGERKENIQDYVIYPDAYVPPGDCIMIVFDSSDFYTTDLLCESWQAKDWNYNHYKRSQITIGDKTWQ